MNLHHCDNLRSYTILEKYVGMTAYGLDYRNLISLEGRNFSLCLCVQLRSRT
jgi:hypothetical protein